MITSVRGGLMLPISVLVLGLVAPVAAQAPDPLFARWRWAPQDLGSRVAGMGGAFVAIADGVYAARENPAGVTRLPHWEVQLSGGEPWLAAGRGLRRVHLAAYVAKTDAQRVDPGGPLGTRGTLESSVWEAGMAVGVEPFRRIKLGAGLAWSRLRLEGERIGPDGAAASGVDGRSGRVRFIGGALINLVGTDESLPSLRLGVTYQPGFEWSVPFTLAGSEATPTGVRRPTVVRTGLSWSLSDRWIFSAQGDVIRYGEVIDTLRRRAPEAASGFVLQDAVEPRVGAELAASLWCGCGVVRVRGGLHYRSPGTLQYEGTDPTLAEAFPRERWRTVASLGASLFAEHFGNALRLDLDSKDVLDGPDLSFGVAWRF